MRGVASPTSDRSPPEASGESEQLLLVQQELEDLRQENERLKNEGEQDRIVFFERIKEKQDALDLALLQSDMLHRSLQDVVDSNRKLDTALVTLADEKSALEERVCRLMDRLIAAEEKRQKAVLDLEELREMSKRMSVAIHGVAPVMETETPPPSHRSWLSKLSTSKGNSKEVVSSLDSGCHSLDADDSNALCSRRQAFQRIPLSSSSSVHTFV